MSKRTFFYKGVRVNALGIPVANDRKEFKKTYRKRDFYYPTFSVDKKSSPRDLIVMYDIPHIKKRERDWFRRQLKNLDYVMVQKSVWVGPSPLPKSFKDYVKRIGLSRELKVLKLSKPFKENSHSL